MAGYDAASIREPAASRLYRWRFPVAKRLHAVERNRRLLAAAIGYDAPATAGAFGLAAGEPRGLLGLPDRYAVLIHGASWPSKLWSEENWRALVEHLAVAGFPVVLPWGGAAEKSRADSIAAGRPLTLVLPHRLEGAELAATIAGATLAIGLDSGLMHLATALGVPGVWLFGPTDPGLTGPYGENQTIVSSIHPEAPCRTRDCAHGPDGGTCMDMVALDRVLAATDGLLKRTRG